MQNYQKESLDIRSRFLIFEAEVKEEEEEDRSVFSLNAESEGQVFLADSAG